MRNSPICNARSAGGNETLKHISRGYRPGTVGTLVEREEKLWEKIQDAEQPLNMAIWKDDDTLLEKHLTTYESLWTKAIDQTTFKKPSSQ